jgi:DNA gyrase/topoisomerase IV subunit A
MQLEKEIMADRITGFYKSLDNIIGTFGIQVKLCDENLMIFKQSKQIIKNQEEVILNFSNAAQERDLLRRDYIELTEIKAELTKQKEKITKIFKEKFTSMQKELNDAVEIRETLRDKLEQADKKYLDIAEEFKRFRQKMKAKFSGISDKEEKFCKNCQKSFFESENFNWSCRVHASKMSGETYWCCGKVGKDSVGCIVSKHISKDEEDLIEDENLNGVLKFCSVFTR